MVLLEAKDGVWEALREEEVFIIVVFKICSYLYNV